MNRTRDLTNLEAWESKRNRQCSSSRHLDAGCPLAGHLMQEQPSNSMKQARRLGQQFDMRALTSLLRHRVTSSH